MNVGEADTAAEFTPRGVADEGHIAGYVLPEPCNGSIRVDSLDSWLRVF